MSEKLTPWDAPYPKSGQQYTGMSPAMRDLLKQLNGGSAQQAAAPQQKLKWYQFFKKWAQKYKGKTWLETPFFYVYFGLMAAVQIPELFIIDEPGDGVVAAFALGVIISIALFIKMKQAGDRFGKKMQQLDIDLARAEGRMAREIELRDEYRRNGRI